jgi:hypothetical protein
MEMEATKPKMEAGFLDGRWVTFVGFKKNDIGQMNIEYVGDDIQGVCMPSFWQKNLKKEKKKKK